MEISVVFLTGKICGKGGDVWPGSDGKRLLHGGKMAGGDRRADGLGGRDIATQPQNIYQVPRGGLAINSAWVLVITLIGLFVLYLGGTGWSRSRSVRSFWMQFSHRKYVISSVACAIRQCAQHTELQR